GACLRRLLAGLLRWPVGDLLQPLLPLPRFARQLFAFGTDRRQLPFGVLALALLFLLLRQATRLLGFCLLALALGQVDLLLATLFFLLLRDACAFAFAIAPHFLLVDRRGVGHPILRARLRRDRRILRPRFGDRLRWRRRKLFGLDHRHRI